MLLATCYLLLATCYLLLAAYYFVLCTLYLVLGTWYLLLGTWYLIFGTCCLVLGTWYLVLATCYLLLATYYLIFEQEEYAVSYAKGLRSELPSAGILVIEDVAINERDATSFPPAFQRIREAGTNIILAIVTDLQFGRLFEAAENASLLQPPYAWITPDALTIGVANQVQRSEPELMSGLFNFYSSHYSLLTTHYSLLTTHYSLLTTNRCTGRS